MSQFLVLLLLICALLLPVIGAVGLRLLRPRLTDRIFYSVAALIFGITVFSVVVLARSDVSTIRLAGLAILLPDDGPLELPTQLVPTSDGSDGSLNDPVTGATNQPTTPVSPLEQATATEISTALPPITTLQPTDAIAITATLVLPTETPIPPTATLIPPTETPIPPTATLIPPTETPIPPTAAPAGPRRYTIQSGDTLRGIAERFGVTVQAILRANNLSAAQADALRPGQELVIP